MRHRTKKEEMPGPIPDIARNRSLDPASNGSYLANEGRERLRSKCSKERDRTVLKIFDRPKRCVLAGDAKQVLNRLRTFPEPVRGARLMVSRGPGFPLPSPSRVISGVRRSRGERRIAS